MLADFEAYTMLVASDLERARDFYKEKLGLEPSMGPDEGVAIFQTKRGNRIVIYEKEGGPKATNTVLGFDVDDLEETLAELKAKGVKQDLRDLPEGAGEDGIVTYGSVKAAWINDSEGNIIGLIENAK